MTTVACACVGVCGGHAADCATFTLRPAAVMLVTDGKKFRNNMPFADTIFAIFSYAIGINLAGFLAFALDKYCARNALWRMPERHLLTLAALGGSVGIVIGQRALRHKTWKQPFRTYLLLIVVIQVIVLLALCIPQVRNELWTFLQQTSSQQKPSQGALPRVTRH
jgi:uncharacterized membrane protein YsdA (DUF1294 family)